MKHRRPGSQRWQGPTLAAGEPTGAVDQPVPVEPVPAGTVPRPYPAKTDRGEPSPEGADQQLNGRFFGLGAAR